MKIKKIALLLVAALCAVCLGVFASACGDGNKDATEYTVTVYYSDGTTTVDGTKVNYQVQICDASNHFCYPTFAKIDANGKASFKMTDVDAAADAANVTDKNYVLHVWDKDDELAFEGLELKETVTVSKTNASVKAVLKNVEAPAK